MFIRNTVVDDIGPISHNGYWYTLPRNSVMAIDESGGEAILRIYKESSSGSTVLPPVIHATKEEWDKKTFALVTRFQIDPTRIPNRNDMVRLAEKYGVDKETLEKIHFDIEGQTYENSDIANIINKLPVPDSVRLPEIETV